MACYGSTFTFILYIYIRHAGSKIIYKVFFLGYQEVCRGCGGRAWGQCMKLDGKAVKLVECRLTEDALGFYRVQDNGEYIEVGRYCW